MDKQISQELVTFIKQSPTAFHAVANMQNILIEHGYEELLEGQTWQIKKGGHYFVTRNNSSIIAFNLGENLDNYSFNVAASHSDSPTFKVKENAEIEIKGKYTQLNTEGYGGMLCATWFDRPLSIAGRVLVQEGDNYVTKLVNIDRDLVMIPNVDLYLYNRMEPSIWGANEEFISCPQLDDLQCAYTSLQGFLKGANKQSINVFACFDNEEVGSGTKQGAGSTFLYDAMRRINNALGKGEEEYYRALASSFMLSADNAHAVHPNHPAKTDVNNCVYMNEGIVVKSHAGQKYTSDAVSIAVFKGLCKKAGVPVQFFSNRSDTAGGSTLGNIAMAQVSMNSVDIGLPQLAMHSSYETAGVKDTAYMIKVMEEFFNSHIEEMSGHILKVTK